MYKKVYKWNNKIKEYEENQKPKITNSSNVSKSRTYW